MFKIFVSKDLNMNAYRFEVRNEGFFCVKESDNIESAAAMATNTAMTLIEVNPHVVTFVISNEMIYSSALDLKKLVWTTYLMGAPQQIVDALESYSAVRCNFDNALKAASDPPTTKGDLTKSMDEASAAFFKMKALAEFTKGEMYSVYDAASDGPYPLTKIDPTTSSYAASILPREFKWMADAFPCIDTKVTHPVYGADNRDSPLSSVIIDLNDYHKWSRDQIADWIETLDLDINIKETGT